MRIAIIGAGGAGLVAGKCCLDAGLDFDILEQTGLAGGTWNYCPYTHLDENGLPVHTSMYKSLKTNLPKELMQMEGLQYPERIKKSYINHEQVLEYILSYKEKFQLEPHLKYFHRVDSIIPPSPSINSFTITATDPRTSIPLTLPPYSHVMVCSGHFEEFTLPLVPGLETFTGEAIHSHHYRVPDKYKGSKVLVVGGGPSGLGVVADMKEVAETVYWSVVGEGVPEGKGIGVIRKTGIEKIENTRVWFLDGSWVEPDFIIFCTGYDYKFPFLNERCGIKIINGKYVTPLYKQIINIECPSMAFIGMPFTVCPFPLFGIQVRFFLSTVTGHFKLPSRDVMLDELKSKEEDMNKRGIPIKYYHKIGPAMGEYFTELAMTANITPIPPVIAKLFKKLGCIPRNFDDCFRIVDDETYEQIA